MNNKKNFIMALIVNILSCILLCMCAFNYKKLLELLPEPLFIITSMIAIFGIFFSCVYITANIDE